jgi:hypothetical protein
MYLRVRENPLTVLYGQSGLGKTSLLGAGLIPKLRVEGFRPVLLRLRYESQDPPLLEQARQALARAVGGEAVGLPPGWGTVGSLWELLHHAALRPQGLAVAPPVLVVNQFEEVFTLGQSPQRRAETAALFEELADMVEDRVPAALQARLRQDRRAVRDYDRGPSPLRLVLALREDFLSHLEAWSKPMPALMERRRGRSAGRSCASTTGWSGMRF